MIQTLGNIRTDPGERDVEEVYAPGTYSVVALDGVSPYVGGERISVACVTCRWPVAEKTIAWLDVYEYIMKGQIQDDIRLAGRRCGDCAYLRRTW